MGRNSKAPKNCRSVKNKRTYLYFSLFDDDDDDIRLKILGYRLYPTRNVIEEVKKMVIDKGVTASSFC
jgi:hypothetical protein